MRHYQTNSKIPRLGYKSALIITVSALLGSFVIPFTLNKIGITWRMIHVIVSGFLPAITTSYCIYFIETDQGISKRFWQVFVALFVIISFISFFWMYNLVMI